jgi:hypothetical protein
LAGVDQRVLTGRCRRERHDARYWCCGAGVGFLVKQFEESNKIAKQTDAVLKSPAARRTSPRSRSAPSRRRSARRRVDDEAIQSGENMLLTFTNVRNEAGKGNNIFTRRRRRSTDMSVALGQDTKNSAIQLGKALNDPIKGITALQRVGVSFTKGQKDQIKSLEESGQRCRRRRSSCASSTRSSAGPRRRRRHRSTS